MTSANMEMKYAVLRKEEPTIEFLGGDRTPKERSKM